MKGNNIIKDTEIYMLAQYIDVLEEIENFKSLEEVKEDIKNRKKIYKKEIKDMTSSDEIFDLDEIDKTLDEKLEEYTKLYCKNNEYKELEKEIKEKKNKENMSKEELEELEDLIYKKCDYDAKFSYKIGLLEGLKIITLK